MKIEGIRPDSCPICSQILEVDPVLGSCSNAYACVHGDPVNQNDVEGALPSCGVSGGGSNNFALWDYERRPGLKEQPGKIAYWVVYGVCHPR